MIKSIGLAIFLLGLTGTAMAQSIQTAQDFDNAIGAAEWSLKTVRQAALAYAQDRAKDITALSGQVTWWQDCVKSAVCWEWVKPPIKTSEATQ